jgi:hypothetical protein
VENVSHKVIRRKKVKLTDDLDEFINHHFINIPQATSQEPKQIPVKVETAEDKKAHHFMQDEK